MLALDLLMPWRTVEGIHDLMIMKRDHLALVKESDDCWAILWKDEIYELSTEYSAHL